MTHTLPRRGFIALVSAIIISVMLLGLATAIGANTFFSRFNALNREYKRISLGLAESCVHVALSKIAENFAYVLTSDPAYSVAEGGLIVPLGTMYDRPTECSISDLTEEVLILGKKKITITTTGSFAGAFSTLSVTLVAQDPSAVPIALVSPLPATITIRSWIEN